MYAKFAIYTFVQFKRCIFHIVVINC